jgi:DNA-binding transcriptional MerR regulator
MKEKFLIGELANLFNITKDTLRYYDKLDVLKPESDENNKYRYYDVRSIFKLSRILFLKNIGVSLNEIKTYMKKKNSGNLLNLLKKKDEEVDYKINQLMNLKNRITSKLLLLENYENDLDKIRVVTMEERHGIFLDIRGARDDSEVKQAFKNSGEFLKISSWLVEGQVYTSLSKKDMDQGIFNRFRYFFEIDSIDEEVKNKLVVLPKCEYACITVLGPYSEMVTHYASLVQWIQENNYEIIGDSIEKNIIDYDFAESESDYVSEIQIPIVKR